MGNRTATVVIEARSLMREGLVSLMEKHSYHIICSVASIADIDVGFVSEAQPQLIILGALPAGCLVEAASSIRRLWQAAKIVVLLDDASATYLQELLASQIDACIPLLVSPCSLVAILQLIVCENLRVAMLSGANIPPTSLNSPENVYEAQDEEVSVSKHLLASSALTVMQAGKLAPNLGDTIDHRTFCHGLSEREQQILKALIRGHSNKMIARMFSVTEATIKVHMKSVLRKIRVANRTQAAIWAAKHLHLDGETYRETAAGPLQAS